MAELNNFANDGGIVISKEEMMKHKNADITLRWINFAIADAKRDIEKALENVNVNFSVSLANKLNEPIVNAMDFGNFTLENNAEKQNIPVSANFNFMKLCSLPKAEVYAVVYKTLFEPFKDKIKSKASSDKVLFGKEEDLENSETAVNDSHFDRQGNYVAPQNTVVEYIKKFLRAVFGIKKEGSDDFDLSAKNIASNLAQRDIGPQELFENPNGINLLAERYAKVSKKESQEQANFLLGEFSKEEFESLKRRDPEQLRVFCDKFARNFLANSGLSENDYRITYNRTDSKGNILSAGSFYDHGVNGQSININLDEMNNITNPAEIVMTLSHELTHLVDSASNKGDKSKADEITKNGGFGLLDNLVGGTGEIEKFRGSNAFDFIQRLETICYRINPNEVSAREGELIALEFMEGLHTTDKSMIKYIEESKKGYDNYVEIVNNAIRDAEKMQSEYKSIEGLIQDENTKNFIKSRLNYIQQLKNKGRLKPIQKRGQKKTDNQEMKGKDIESENEGLT